MPTARTRSTHKITGGFHAAVCDAGGNPVIGLAAKSIQSIWTQRISSTIIARDDRHHVHRDHAAIARAIERRDAKRAERLMRDHMRFYQDYCEARYPARMDEVVEWD